MRNLLLLLCGLTLIGCEQLRPDETPSPGSLNYATVETLADQHREIGVNGFFLHDGDVVLEHALQVVTVAVGQLHVMGCGADYAVEYTNSETVNIDLVKIFGQRFEKSERCMLALVVTPKYPSQATQPIKVYPFIGFVVFGIFDKTDQPLQVDGRNGFNYRQVKDGSKAQFSFLAPEDGRFGVACNGLDVQEGDAKGGTTVTIALPFLSAVNDGNCQLGYIGQKDFYSALYRLQVYKKEAIALPFPKVEPSPIAVVSANGNIDQTKWKYKITSPAQVSYVRMNDSHSNSLTNTVTADQDIPMVIRQYSVAGRSTLSVYVNGKVEYEK
jgi:hypothetical protein